MKLFEAPLLLRRATKVSPHLAGTSPDSQLEVASTFLHYHDTYMAFPSLHTSHLSKSFIHNRHLILRYEYNPTKLNMYKKRTLLPLVLYVRLAIARMSRLHKPLTLAMIQHIGLSKQGRQFQM